LLAQSYLKYYITSQRYKKENIFYNIFIPNITIFDLLSFPWNSLFASKLLSKIKVFTNSKKLATPFAKKIRKLQSAEFLKVIQQPGTTGKLSSQQNDALIC